MESKIRSAPTMFLIILPSNLQNLNSSDYEDCLESVRKFMQHMVRHSLGPQLLHTVDILLHQYSSSSGGGWAKGSSHDIALNFVKYMTKILSLDPFLTEEVSGLRRTLLAQVIFRCFPPLFSRVN